MAKTLQRLWPQLPVYGITRLADITGLDTIGIPVVTAVRPAAKNLSAGQGKGLTPELATASAIMEAIETYHAENLRPPERVCCKDRLAADDRIDPGALPSGHRALPETTELGWIAGANLASGRDIWIPRDLINLDTSCQIPEADLFMPTSNGLAAGNSLAEATCHALYELIERECVAAWQAVTIEEAEARLVDLDSIRDRALKGLVKAVRDAGILVFLYDITSEIGVPAYSASIIDGTHHWRRLPAFAGGGCHADPTVAAIRALCEAIQSRLVFIAGVRDDTFPRSYDRVLADDSWQPPAERNGTTRFGNQQPMQPTDSFEDDVTLLVSTLQRCGLQQVAVACHSDPGAWPAVVHVVVPGLRFGDLDDWDGAGNGA